jgi:ADP-heptose:LPS heptosyltransferase
MAVYKLLVPSGIGDFSWAWSKLNTTNDQYHIEYVGGKPDRMFAFLSLLPQEKILSFAPNGNYYTKWDEKGELMCLPRNPKMFPEIPKMRKYSDLAGGSRMFVEPNTYLEAGNRIEAWLRDEIPKTDFHYKIEGTVHGAKKANYFIVNYSSFSTKKAWGYYETEKSVEFIDFISAKTGWLPIFIGGSYDDYTQDIFEKLVQKRQCICMVGKTPDLTAVISLLQQAQAYVGACSGLMAISNILYTPTVIYYPPFQTPPGRRLAGTWHDKSIAYLPLFWGGVEQDKEKFSQWVISNKLIKV